MADDEHATDTPSNRAESVIAIAASATSALTLSDILTRLHVGSEMGVVVVLQHREALNETALSASLATAGRAFTRTSDGTAVEGGRIYLADANQILSLDGDFFRVTPARQKPGERGTIDSFLVSLARNEDGRSIGVILSGTGGDGVLGVTAIKEAGGIVIAEDVEDVAPMGGATPAALADFVLPTSALVPQIEACVRHLSSRIAAPAVDDDTGEIGAVLTSIAGVLRNKTGHDFHGYKRGTFLRRVQRRMQVTQVDDIRKYVELLRVQPEEVQNLFDDLLIGVTQFFRDQKEFALLERDVIPRLFEGKGRGDQLRVWVIGCSTGEEAYSIAILLREHLDRIDSGPQLQVFATDIDARSLASARVGRYADSIAKDLTPERLARWFVREGNTYCVARELREICIFSQHSVIKDAPFSRIDLISCRNLLIYLNAELQNKVIPLFHFSLRSGGYLFLGSSENVSRHPTLFAAIESRFRIFRRLETGTRILPDFPLTAIDGRTLDQAGPLARVRTVESNLARRAERIADRYAPAYVIIDETFNVLHFSGRTGRFIDPAGGAATLNLLTLIHPDLRSDMRAALSKAAEQNRTVQINNLRVGMDGYRLLLDLVVEPVQDTPSSPRSFVVLFRDGATLGDGETEESLDPMLRRDEHVQRLEQELRTANERLQATIEELESTNEELKSSNEEYQSLNEELQSANEELETSKEELQSVNEELTTVNGELAHRVHELGRANGDLKNLLERTQIATIFLDNDLRVMNFTPAVTEIFPLVQTDIGRPIGHIKSRVTYDDLQDDVRRVLRTLGGIDRDVSDPRSGTRYMVRVLPYRSVDNYIGGAVVTFVDTTPLTAAQHALRDSEERFRAVADLVPDLLFSGEPSGAATWFNHRWIEYTGQSMEAAQGSGWLEALHPDDRQDAASGLVGVVTQGTSLVLQQRLRGAGDEYRWFLIRVEPRRDESGAVIQWFGAATDIHDQRTALDALTEREAHAKLLLGELQHRVQNSLAVARSIAQRTAVASTSIEEMRTKLDGRLGAFARAQAAVTKNPAAGVDLEELVRAELDAQAPGDEVHVSGIDGPRLRLKPAGAEKLALAIHELVTNAAKHGALSQPDGRIEVNWRVADDRIVINWDETGMKLDGRRPVHSGFGSELLQRALVYDLDGQVDWRFEPDGVKCSLSLPRDRMLQ
jgi:two-component system CheB/CheR fusion protein